MSVRRRNFETTSSTADCRHRVGHREQAVLKVASQPGGMGGFLAAIPGIMGGVALARAERAGQLVLLARPSQHLEDELPAGAKPLLFGGVLGVVRGDARAVGIEVSLLARGVVVRVTPGEWVKVHDPGVLLGPAQDWPDVAVEVQGSNRCSTALLTPDPPGVVGLGRGRRRVERRDTVHFRSEGELANGEVLDDLVERDYVEDLGSEPGIAHDDPCGVVDRHAGLPGLSGKRVAAIDLRIWQSSEAVTGPSETSSNQPSLLA